MIKKFIMIALVALGSIGSLSATEFKVGGVYTAWAQSQHSFLLTKDAYDMNYIVQMLRFTVQGIANENVKFVTRFDIAQGWWGVDNQMRTLTNIANRGSSATFDFKDANYLVHVDQAYVDFSFPSLPLTMQVGRQWFGLGHKIMVDNNYEGIHVGIGKSARVGWAKVSEGADNTTDSYDADLGVDNRDADLFTACYKGKAGNLAYSAFGLYYSDKGVEDNKAFVHDDLQFFKTRFSPQVTQLTAVGVTANYKAGKLSVDGEFDFLMGKDDIANASYAGKKLDSYDINDGTLSGFNLYVKANYAASDALSAGAIFGLGSGDDDLTGGKGNVNKLRTSGFFYITEIWEDSIMPDEEGITPQGLGAPNVRGYRELENSTIIQGNVTYKGFPRTSIFLSGSMIMATNPIPAWAVDVDTDSDGVADAVSIDNGTNAKDLGTEVDFKIDYKLVDNLSFSLRGGYFIPGDAAGYLINGNTTNLDPVYEVKGVILYKF